MGKFIHTWNVYSFILMLLASTTPVPDCSLQLCLKSFASFVLLGLLKDLLFLFEATFILQGHPWALETTRFFLWLLISQEEGKPWSIKQELEMSQLSRLLSRMYSYNEVTTCQKCWTSPPICWPPPPYEKQENSYLFPPFVCLIWNMVSFINFRYLLWPLIMATTWCLPW